MLKEKAKYNIATIAEMTSGITLSNKNINCNPKCQYLIISHKQVYKPH